MKQKEHVLVVFLNNIEVEAIADWLQQAGFIFSHEQDDLGEEPLCPLPIPIKMWMQEASINGHHACIWAGIHGNGQCSGLCFQTTWCMTTEEQMMVNKMATLAARNFEGIIYNPHQRIDEALTGGFSYQSSWVGQRYPRLLNIMEQQSRRDYE